MDEHWDERDEIKDEQRGRISKEEDEEKGG
jgi:hypothetical protein